jgi:hypothetical protein
LEAHFSLFVYGTSGGSYRKNLVSGLSEASISLPKCGSLPSTGSVSNIDRMFARAEHCFDGAPLFGREVVRKLKVAALAEAVIAIHPVVNDCDHAALTLEARMCSNFIPIGDESPPRWFKGESGSGGVIDCRTPDLRRGSRPN